MRTHVGKWGSSCAIRLPKMAVETLGLRAGAPVSIDIENGAIVIRKDQPGYNLADLVEEAKRQGVPESEDDGPVGRETL